MNEFQNVSTALITPFYRGEVDEESFRRLLHQQLEAGIRGFVINGTTAESPALTNEEVKRLFEIARTEAGTKASLILGCGTNSTATTIEKTRAAERLGADAALLVVPYYNRPPQRGLKEHFAKVAAGTKLPILIYNVPSRTACPIEPTTVKELSAVDNIVGIKEASGDLAVLRELQTISRRPFWLLSGDDATGVEFCHRGGHGIISVVSHVIPEELGDLVKKARRGDAGAVSSYSDYKDLLDWLYIESNPIPVKWALKEMGVIRSAELRLPLVTLSETFEEGYRKCLKKLNKV